MKEQIKKAIAILIVVLFVVTVTAGAVSAMFTGTFTVGNDRALTVKNALTFAFCMGSPILVQIPTAFPEATNNLKRYYGDQNKLCVQNY